MGLDIVCLHLMSIVVDKTGELIETWNIRAVGVTVSGMVRNEQSMECNVLNLIDYPI